MNTYRKSEIPPHLLEFFEPSEIGLEPTPADYVSRLVEVFREVRRVLRDDGTCWVNLGDSYASGGRSTRDTDTKLEQRGMGIRPTDPAGIKPKDLIGIPWRVAFALQADGWYLRQDIIWSKPNPMPESVTDRCTKAHEYLFLLTKSARYFYDAEAVKEECLLRSNFGPMRYEGRLEMGQWSNTGEQADSTRNRRSVWTIATHPYTGAHFAVMPPALVEPCILAGSRQGDLIIDPFGGSGTVGAVAVRHGRRAALIELNPDYQPLIVERLTDAQAQPDLFIQPEPPRAEQTALFDAA